MAIRSVTKLLPILLSVGAAVGGHIAFGRAADVPDAAKMALGKRVFTELAVPACGVCHTLKDAGTSGTIGAKLEEIQPDAQQVALAVRNGVGVMPPFSGKLTEEQIAAVALYVSVVSRKK